MSHQDDKGRNAAIHHSGADNKSGANDPKAAIHKPKTNPDDQARHGGGEGTSGIQSGDGHRRGR